MQTDTNIFLFFFFFLIFFKELLEEKEEREEESGENHQKERTLGTYEKDRRTDRKVKTCHR